jgi:hypothetical protein
MQIVPHVSGSDPGRLLDWELWLGMSPIPVEFRYFVHEIDPMTRNPERDTERSQVVRARSPSLNYLISWIVQAAESTRNITHLCRSVSSEGIHIRRNLEVTSLLWRGPESLRRCWQSCRDSPHALTGNERTRIGRFRTTTLSPSSTKQRDRRSPPGV